MDRWDGDVYSRVLQFNGQPVLLRIKQVAPPHNPVLEAQPVFFGNAPSDEWVIAQANRLLGAQVNLDDFYWRTANDGEIGQLVHRFRGVKPPRFPTLFEALVNGIACQQVSLHVGIGLISDLARRFGASLSFDGMDYYAFPEPDPLAAVSSLDLRNMKFSLNKGRAIVELAQDIMSGKLNEESIQGMPDEEALIKLRSLRGIGPWTAQYALLRGMGRYNFIPNTDSGASRGFRKLLGLQEKPQEDYLQKILEPWEPYKGLIYYHLLLNRLHEAGYLK